MTTLLKLNQQELLVCIVIQHEALQANAVPILNALAKIVGRSILSQLPFIISLHSATARALLRPEKPRTQGAQPTLAFT